MKEKQSVVSDKNLLFDRKMFDLFKECIMEMSTYFYWYYWQSLINDLDRSTGIYKEEVHLKTAIMLFINAALKYGPGKVSSFYLHITDVNYKYMGVILVGEIKFKK